MCNCDSQLRQIYHRRNSTTTETVQNSMDLSETKVKQDQCPVDPTTNWNTEFVNHQEDTTTCQSQQLPAMQNCSSSSDHSNNKMVIDGDQLASHHHRRRSCPPRQLKKAGRLLHITLTTIAVLFLLDLWTSQLISTSVEAAAVRRLPRHNNVQQKQQQIWERPCGDGRYHEKAGGNKNNDTKKKKNHIRDVLMHTKQMMNTLNEKQQEPHWVDGDWEHTLPEDFDFPDISHFSFRKAHSALQQYMAIFQKFTSVQNDRRALKGTFEKMQSDTKALLCLIESVINGTKNANRQRAFADGVVVAPKGQRQPAFRYYTQHVMVRKLKGLTDVLTEENILPIAKVVFNKFTEFVKVVSAKAALRVAKLKRPQLNRSHVNSSSNNNGVVANNKVGGSESVQPVVNEMQVLAAVAGTKKSERKNKNHNNKHRLNNQKHTGRRKGLRNKNKNKKSNEVDSAASLRRKERRNRVEKRN